LFDIKFKMQIKKVFGKEENRNYKLKRNIFFITIIILFLIALFFRRYINFLINIQYLQIFNLASIIGIAIVIFSFHLADRSFNINFKKRHYFYVYFMSITGISLSVLYYKLPYYDKVEHFFFPMMFASIVFYLLTKKVKLTKFWKLSFVFFIIVGSISLFELLEYFLDFLFNWKLQGVFIENPIFIGGYEEILNRIDDTMIDIAIGVIGTLVYVFSVVFMRKRNGNN